MQYAEAPKLINLSLPPQEGAVETETYIKPRASGGCEVIK